MASDNSIEKHHLGRLSFTPNTVRLIRERSSVFDAAAKQYNSLSGVRKLEPDLKMTGPYRTVDKGLQDLKKSILSDLDKRQEHYNQLIQGAIEQDFKDRELDDELKSMKDYDIQELLDDEIQKQHLAGKGIELIPNSQIDQFLRDHGFEKDKSKVTDIDKQDKSGGEAVEKDSSTTRFTTEQNSRLEEFKAQYDVFEKGVEKDTVEKNKEIDRNHDAKDHDR